MAIAFRAGAYAGDATGTSSTVTKPTGTADGDILILGLYNEDASDPPTGLSPPSGFTLIQNGLASSPFSVRVYWKRASSEGANYSITWTDNVWHAEVLLAFSGCVASGSPIDTSAAGTEGSGSTLTYPSVTTTVADAMLVLFGASYGGGEGAPAGFSAGAGDGGGSGAGYYKLQAATGATGTFGGAAHAAYPNLGHTLALIPAGGGGGLSIPVVMNQYRQRVA